MNDYKTQNTPNTSLMFTAFTTTFGNMSFAIQPPPEGDMERGFPSIPYVSIEAIFYQQQSSNPLVSTQNVLTGSTAGTQNISGSQTVTDTTGNVRVQIGYGQY